MGTPRSDYSSDSEHSDFEGSEIFASDTSAEEKASSENSEFHISKEENRLSDDDEESLSADDFDKLGLPVSFFMESVIRSRLIEIILSSIMQLHAEAESDLQANPEENNNNSMDGLESLSYLFKEPEPQKEPEPLKEPEPQITKITIVRHIGIFSLHSRPVDSQSNTPQNNEPKSNPASPKL